MITALWLRIFLVLLNARKFVDLLCLIPGMKYSRNDLFTSAHFFGQMPKHYRIVFRQIRFYYSTTFVLTRESSEEKVLTWLMKFDVFPPKRGKSDVMITKIMSRASLITCMLCAIIVANYHAGEERRSSHAKIVMSVWRGPRVPNYETVIFVGISFSQGPSRRPVPNK